jgi:hypothetical protein
MNEALPPAIAEVAPEGNLTRHQMRHLLIKLAQRRAQPGTGSSRAFMERRTAMNPWPDLRPVLQDIDWAIIGGVATRAYMPERMTQDLDVLVKSSDSEKAIEQLEAAGYIVVSQLAIPGFQLRSPDGVEIDLILSEAEWVAEALKNPTKDAAGYPVLSLPYLILMKLDSSRAQDVADMAQMLGGATEETLDKVRATVAQYRPEDSEDLESLIFLGKKEQETSS